MFIEPLLCAQSCEALSVKQAGFMPRSWQPAGDTVSLLMAPDSWLVWEGTHQRLSEEAALEQDLRKMKGN